MPLLWISKGFPSHQLRGGWEVNLLGSHAKGSRDSRQSYPRLSDSKLISLRRSLGVLRKASAQASRK